MANFKQHVTVSGAAAAFTYLILCQRYHRPASLSEALAAIGVGVLGGIVPDALEPALHPHHRQFCHSVTAGGLLLQGVMNACRAENNSWTDSAKILAACVAIGYITHLVMDGCTPRGLPLIGN